MTESHLKKRRSQKRPFLTKIAFILVSLVAVVGFMKIWTERRSHNAPGETLTQEGSKVVLEKDVAGTFAPLLSRLNGDAFFGLGEINGGYTITVAGYVGERVTTDEGTKIEVFPFFAEERRKPVYITLLEEDTKVSTTVGGQEKTQSFSKIKGRLKKGTPVVITTFFADEFEYMLAVRGLEQLNDYILLEYEDEPRFVVSFPSTSILSVELL